MKAWSFIIGYCIQVMIFYYGKINISLSVSLFLCLSFSVSLSLFIFVYINFRRIQEIHSFDDM